MIGTPREVTIWLTHQDPKKKYEIKQHRKKRSLDSNAYAWQLITKIADALTLEGVPISKEALYFDMLKMYGQSEIISVLSHINLGGFVKYFEKIGTATLQGKEFTHYKVYKGSSEFDSREMAIFINGIVNEAQQHNIETLSPLELMKLEKHWKEHKKEDKT